MRCRARCQHEGISTAPTRDVLKFCDTCIPSKNFLTRQIQFRDKFQRLTYLEMLGASGRSRGSYNTETCEGRRRGATGTDMVSGGEAGWVRHAEFRAATRHPRGVSGSQSQVKGGLGLRKNGWWRRRFEGLQLKGGSGGRGSEQS